MACRSVIAWLERLRRARQVTNDGYMLRTISIDPSKYSIATAATTAITMSAYCLRDAGRVPTLPTEPERSRGLLAAVYMMPMRIAARMPGSTFVPIRGDSPHHWAAWP
jgi:hypothetical protein